MTRRILAILLSVMMMLSLAPSAVFADDSDDAVNDETITATQEDPAEEPAEEPEEDPSDPADIAQSVNNAPLRESGETKTVLVGVISYVINDLGSNNWQVHYWNSDGSGDADCTAAELTQSRSVGSEYWNGDAQTFTLFTAEVPVDATGYKVHNGDRWFGDDGSLANDHPGVYVFNYSGDKARYINDAPQIFTVTFKRSETVLNTEKVLEGQTVSAPSDITLESNEFWSIGESVSWAEYDFNTPVTSDLVLCVGASITGGGEPIQMGTLYFMKNDGSDVKFTQAQSALENYLPECPWTRDGYSFLGWSMSAAGGDLFQPGDDLEDALDVWSSDEDYTFYAQWQAVVAKIGDVGYPTLQAAIDAAHNGDEIVMIANAEASAIVEITKSITLNGNGKTLTTTANRAIWIDAGNVDVTIKDLTIIPGSGTERAIQVNTDCDNVTLTIDGVTASATMYTVNICGSVDNLSLTIKDSNLTGWGVINLWGNNGVVNITDSELIGINDKTYNADGWNNFGVIVLEGDTTGQTNEHSSAYVVTIKDSTIEARSTTGNGQSVVLYNNPSVNNEVVLEGCTIKTGDNCTFLFDNAEGSVTKLKDTTDEATDEKPVLPEGYAYKQDGSYFVVDTAIAKVEDTYFATFAEASAAANGTKTITLLDDVTYTLAEDESVIIDPNGHTFTPSVPEGCILKTATADGITTYTAKRIVVREYTYSFDGKEVMLSEILQEIGMTETVTSAVSDYDTLLKVEQSGEDWKVSALKPFSSTEDILFTAGEINGIIHVTNTATKTVWTELVDRNAPASDYAVIDETNKTVTVSTALGLAWVAYMTNTSSESWNPWGWFGGYTVQLGADIDLSGYLWAPIGNSNTFDGTFDGCNHTISNLRQNVYEQQKDYVGTAWSVGGANGTGPFGLFGYFTGVAVRNLTMDGAYVFSEGGAIGVVAGYAYDNAVFENITVKNSHLNGYSRGVGCVVGYATRWQVTDAVMTFSHITVDNTNVMNPVYNAADTPFGCILGNQGVPSSGTFKTSYDNCELSAQVMQLNDCTMAYDYWLYRDAGMLIGLISGVEPGADDFDASKYVIIGENVNVIYEDWNQGHYCEFQDLGIRGNHVRIDGPDYHSWSKTYERDGHTIVIADMDQHYHREGEDHDVILVFDQLIGARTGGKGVRHIEGVNITYKNTVNVNQYPTWTWTEDGQAVAHFGDVTVVDPNPVNENGQIVSTIVYDGDTYIATLDLVTVTFNTNGGSEVPARQAVVGQTIEAPETIPTKEHYSFVQWCSDEALTTEFDFTQPITEDVTAYAKWLGDPCTITFIDGSTGDVLKTVNTNYGEPTPVFVPDPLPTREGYDLDTNNLWTPVPTETVTGSKFYSLNWIKLHKVTIDPDNGTAVQEIYVDDGKTIAKPDDPTREGYTFDDWYDGNNKFVFTHPIYDDVVVKAKWNINQYTVTFMDGDTELAKFADDYGKPITEPEVTPREGYFFKGWDIAVPATIPAQDLTINAVWGKAVAKVTDSENNEVIYESLQEAVNAAHALTGDVTVTLLTDTAENVWVHQKLGLNLTITGENKPTIEGQLILDGEGSFRSDTLTIDGLKIVKTANTQLEYTDSLIIMPSTTGVAASQTFSANHNNYAHHITIKNCDFDANGDMDVAAIRAKNGGGSFEDINLYNLTVQNMHSVAQFYSSTDFVVDGLVATNVKNGINCSNQHGEVKITNATIEAQGYAFRLQTGSDASVELGEGNTFSGSEGIIAKSTTASTINITAGNYSGPLTQENNGKFNITGGFFTVVPALEYCGVDAEGNQLYPVASDNADYPYTVGSPVAVVKNFGYPSVADAKVARTDENDVITLLKSADYAFVAGDILKIYKANDDIVFTYTVEDGFALRISEPDAEGVVTYTVVGAVAKIEREGETLYFASLAEAVAEAQNGETIIMIADERIDVSGYAVTIPAAKNIVLDLNGHEVIGQCNDAGTSALIRNLGTLTIQDSGENGKLIGGADPTWTWDGSDDYSGSYASNLIRNEGTLVVDSGYLYNASTGSAAYAIDNYGSGKITINGGTVDAKKASAIRMFYCNGGVATVNGGTVGHYTDDDDCTYMGIQVMSGTNAVVNVNGGTIAGMYALYSSGTEESAVNISGGSFDGYVGFGSAGPNTIEISGGTFFEWAGTWGSQTEFISGGEYAVKPDAEYIVRGKCAIQREDEWWIIGEAVAEIGTIGYATLEAAFAAAKDGETIKVLKDCAGNGIKVPEGKFTNGLTVDFDGHTYDFSGKGVGSTGTEYNGFQLLKDNTITFKNGTITATSEDAGFLIQNYSNLTLDGMTIDGTGVWGGYVLSNNNGNVVIKDTTITAKDGDFAFDVCRYASYPSVSVTVTGNSKINGNIEVSASDSDAKNGFSLMLEGGTYTGEIILDASAEAAMAATPDKATVKKAEAVEVVVPKDYKWVETDTVGVLKLVPKDYVAENTTTGEKYETLEEAIAEAQNGETVKLLKDCAGNGIKVPEGKFTNGLTVDFGGFTYTVNGTTVGSTNTETQGFQLLKDNKITFKNGAITGNSRETDSLVFLIQNYSDLTLDGMTLSLVGTYYGQYTLSNNNGEIVIKDSTINAPDYSWANLSASDVQSFAFDVCRYSSYSSVSVTVTGNSVINGDIEVSATGSDAKDGLSLMLESGTYSGAIVLDESGAAAMAADPEKATVKKAEAVLIVIPKDYKWVETETAGVLKLVPKDYVAENITTGEKYETLEEAIAAVQDGETIELLKDVTEDVVIDGGKNFTLDLKEKTLTGAIDQYDANVTITNGTVKGTIYSNGLETGKTGSLTIAEDAVIESGYAIILWQAEDNTGNGQTININGTINGIVWVMGNIVSGDSVINVNGTVNSTDDVAIALNGYATVNVYDGAVVEAQDANGKGVGIEVRAGKLNVTGGTITGHGAFGYTPNGSGTTTVGAAIAVAQHTTKLDVEVSITGGTLVADTDNDGKLIAVTDAQENGLDKVKVEAKNVFVVGTETKLPDGFAWGKKADTEDMYEIVTAVAKIDDQYFATLAAAIAAVQDGETIELLKDVTEDVVIDGGKNFTLDLKEKTMTGAIDQYDANITITNGTVKGTIYSNGLETGKTGSLTIAADAVIESDYAIILWQAEDNTGNGQTININGTVNGIVWVMGNIVSGDSVINVKGTVNSTDDVAIALNGYATVNVYEGASIEAKDANGKGVGIEVRAGKLNVTGGTIKGNGVPTEVTSNGSGTTSTGAGIAIAQHTTKLPIEVNISGGTISGYSAFYESNPENNSEEDLAKIEVSITGGDFTATEGGTNSVYSEDLTAFISDGRYSTEPDPTYIVPGKAAYQDGEWWLIGEAVAAIGDIGYMTLAAAAEAVQPGETIVMLKDVTIDAYVELHDANLDLAGHTITGPNTSGVLDCYGTVTVSDSSEDKTGKITSGVWGVWANGDVKITLDGVTIEAGTYAIVGEVNDKLTIKDSTIIGHEYGINVFGSGEVTLDNSKVTSDGDWGIAVFDTVKLHVTNGSSVEATGAESIGISTNGNAGNNATIVIEEGTTVSGGELGIYMPSGNLTVNGGTITGATAIYVKSGKTEIKGGTINGTGAVTEYNHNGNGANATGDAIVVENCGYPSGAPTVTITGGEFGTAGGKQVGAYYTDAIGELALTTSTDTLTVLDNQMWIETENAGVYKLVEAVVVTFVTENGIEAPEAQRIEKGTKATKPADPVKEHYIFLGWFADGATEAFDFDTAITEDITLTAMFEGEPITILYVNEDGTILQKFVVHYNDTVDAYTFTAFNKIVVPTGYKYYDDERMWTETVVSPATEDAVYVLNLIEGLTVTFNPDNGENTWQVDVDAKDKVARPTTDPSKEGYFFMGWYNGNNEYDFDTPVTASITLTAKWEAYEYEITYEWADDLSTVTATAHCTNAADYGAVVPDVTETVSTTNAVTKEATGDENGEITYTAEFTNELFETQNKVVNTPKLPKAQVEPIDPPKENAELYTMPGMTETPNVVDQLEAEYMFTALPADDDTLAAYGDWNCDYRISFDKAIDKETFGLYGAYGSYSVAFKYPTDLAKDQQVYLLSGLGDTLTYSTVYNSVSPFDCGVFNLSEGNIGKTITVELVIWKGEQEIVLTSTSYTFRDVANVICVHDWNTPTYVWADDNSTVTATRVCKYDDTHIETETVTTTVTVTPATLDANGAMVYTATFENEAFETQIKTVVIPKLPNASVEEIIPAKEDVKLYTMPGLEETGDILDKLGAEYLFTALTPDDDTLAYYSDWNCDYRIRFNDDIAANSFGLYGAYGTEFGEGIAFQYPADLHENESVYLLSSAGLGNVTYSTVYNNVSPFDCGVFNLDDENVGKKITVELVIWAPDATPEDAIVIATTTYKFKELSHIWKFVDFTWTETADGYMAVANYKCKYDANHTTTLEATVTSEVATPATCEGAGSKVYTATVTDENSLDYAEHTDTKTVEVEAIGHDWEFVDFTWTETEDGYTAVANYKCKNDESHTTTVDATVVKTEQAATAEADGAIIYTATVTAEASADGEEHVDTKTIVIPGLPKAKVEDVDPAKEDVVLYDRETLEATGDVVDQLEAEFKFTALDVSDATYNYYKNWNCDYRVTFNADFAAESFGMYGEYTGWGNTYEVGFLYPNAVSMGDSIYLLNSVAPNLVQYKDLYDVVKTFYCGVFNLSEQNIGKSITVDLVIWQGDNTDDAIVITSTTYTFKGLSHIWEFVDFTWTETADGYTAVANYKCKADERHTATVDATVTCVTTDATCEEAGSKVYTATVTDENSLDYAEHIGTKTDEIEALGHDWEFVDFTWTETEDGYTAVANYKCKNDASHTKTENATVTSKKTDATCEAAGQIVYTATEGEHTDTKTVVLEALGHDWEFVDFTWTETADGYTAVANYKCKNDESHTKTENATVTSEKTDATCEAAGQIVYTATEGEHTDTKTVALEAIGHDWGEATYEWADDNSTVTAKRVCKNDSTHVETETVSTTSEVTKPATATENGEITYTATFENEAFETQIKVVEIPSLPLAKVDPVDPAKEDVALYTMPDLTPTGETLDKLGAEYLFTALEVSEATYNYYKNWHCDYRIKFNDDISAGTFGLYGAYTGFGNNYEVGFKYPSDLTENESVYLLKSAGLNDVTYADIYDIIKTFDCGVFNLDDENVGKKITVELVIWEGDDTDNAIVLTSTTYKFKELSHIWEFVDFTWTETEDGYTAVANYKCTYDPTHTTTLDATVTCVTTDATCEGAGSKVYTATVTAKDSLDYAEHISTKTDEIEALGHDWEFVDFTWTETEDGYTAVANYKCKNDASHTKTENATVTSKKTDATCEEAGQIVYTATEGENTEDKIVVLEAIGHDWGEATYEWATDYSTCTATRVCKNDPSHVETETVNAVENVITPATCEAKGESTFTATFTNEAFAEQTKTVETEALGHAYGEASYTWSEDNSTCTGEMVCANDPSHKITKTVTATLGTVTAATCEEAGEGMYVAIFMDPFRTQVKTVEIPALGHDWKFVDFTWTETEDGYTAVANYVCNNNAEHTQTVEATVTVTADSNYTTYTATVTAEASLDETEHTDTKKIPLTPAFMTQALVLEGQIGVYFYVRLPQVDGYEYEGVDFTIDNTDGADASVPFDPDMPTNSKGYYQFTYYVRSIEMADTITATLKYKLNGEDKTLVKTYTVKEYFETYDNNMELFNEKLRAMTEATADYGHYVQAFLETQRTWTIGTDYTEMDKHYKDYTAEDISAAETGLADYVTVKSTGTNVAKISYTLVLDSDTEVRVYFKPATGYTGTFTFTANGETITEDGGKISVKLQSDGRYMVSIKNIAAHELRNVYTIKALSDGDEASITVSALSYVQAIMTAYAGNEKAINAAVAIYRYAMAAKALRP